MINTESSVNPANLAFVEELYESFLRDSSSVSPEWRDYFSKVANGELRFPAPRFGPSFKPSSIFNHPGSAADSAAAGRISAFSGSAVPEACAPTALQDRIYLLIRLYRVRGHRIAQVDPLGRIPPTPPELEPEFFG